MTAKELLTKIDGIFDQPNLSLQQKIDAYREVIPLCKKNDDYELLYAWYQIMNLASHDKNLHQQCLEAAHKCLDLLRNKTISNFGAEVEYDAIRYGTNVVVWDQLDNGQNPNFEELLELIEWGIRYSEIDKSPYIFDTKARVLLKLDRTDEAYRIIRTCVLKNRDIDYFDDIINTEEYKNWKEGFEAALVTNLSESETKFLFKAKETHLKLQQRLADEKNNPQNFVEQIPEKKILTYAEAKKKHDLREFSHELNENSYLLVFKGNLYIKSDLKFSWIKEQLKDMDLNPYKDKYGLFNLYGMLVEGDLVVNGSLVEDDYCTYFITKNFKCNEVHNIAGYVSVKENMETKCGIYNTSEGFIEVLAKSNSPYHICEEYLEENIEDTICIEAESFDRDDLSIVKKGGYNPKYIHNAQKLFNPAVWDKETGTFSVKQFYDLVRQGKNPFIEI